MPRHRRRCCCRIVVVSTAVVILANLALFIISPSSCSYDVMTSLQSRINSWRDMLCRPALLCARATTACIPFNRSSSLSLSFVPTERRCITTSSYSWLLCHSCRVSFMSVILPRMLNYHQLTTPCSKPGDFSTDNIAKHFLDNNIEKFKTVYLTIPPTHVRHYQTKLILLLLCASSIITRRVNMGRPS